MTAEEFTKIVNAAQIVSVNLIQFQCERYNLLPGDYSISLKIDTDKEKSADRLKALVALTFGIVGTQDDDESEIASFHASYVVTYILPGKFPEKSMEYFVSRNATFNTYPYFRELVDSHLRRMGMAPVALPLLKPGMAGHQEFKFNLVAPEKAVGASATE